MNNFMKLPNLIPATENKIIEENRRYSDVKHVAKVFDINVKEMKNILKQAGIKIRKMKNQEENDLLRDNGITEGDFYNDGN